LSDGDGMHPPAGADPSPFLGVARSLTDRLWRARSCDDRLAQAFAQQLELPDMVARVMAGRGIALEDGEAYLNPTLKALLPDPSTLLGMDRAAERIAAAIMASEDVAVFGDYDVDGATSSALLKRFFDAAGGRLRIYIPDRMAEGYGPNWPAMQRLHDDGVGLVVTVDCGISAFEPLAEAHAAGLDVIVVDHHLAEPRLPDAVAVVNPNRLDETTPHRQLAAVGVTLLVIVAVNRALRQLGWYGERAEPNLMQWLDLVALGTICDVVPLVGLNRPLVFAGLKVMARRANTGLSALGDVARMNEPPGTYHAGFLLGPRVNAGGRVGRADLGARLLTTGDAEEARRLAEELDGYNRERREIEQQVLAEADAQITEQVARQGLPALVAAIGEAWHPGVIGIVASRLKERFNRPAFVLSLGEGVAKGSGRSVPGVDLGAAVTAARQTGLLVNGGGHAMAAGITVEADKLGDLVAFLLARLEPQVAAATAGPSLGFDGALSVAGVRRDLLDMLERAGPYGAGNPEPRFAVPGARLVKADVVGQGHVRCILAGADGARLKGIAFRSMDGALGPALLNHGGRPLHVAGHIRADNWRGENGVQLVIEDAAHP